MGTVPPRIIPPPGRVAPLETTPIQKKPPLRKCMQCHEVKRERFSVRCQACEEANEWHYQKQKAAGAWPIVDENLIGWVYPDTIPGLYDYLLCFLRWLKSRFHRKRESSPQGQSNAAQLILMREVEHDQTGLTAQQAADALTMAFVHGKPSIYDFIPGYQPKDEPLPQEQYPVVQMECEVSYE